MLLFMVEVLRILGKKTELDGDWFRSVFTQ